MSAVRKDFAQNVAGGGGEGWDVFGVGDAKFFVKELRDLFFFEVRGGGDDVTRLFFAQLHNVFAEVGFDDVDAMFFERVVEFDLFADHAFGFGDECGSPTTPVDRRYSNWETFES
jgi:hypothetical protein